MKKIFILLLLTIVYTSTTSAQFIKFGVKTGLNFSQLKFDEIKNISTEGNEYSLSEDENFMGFHIGVMTRIKIFNAFLQPEVYFNTSGGKVLIEEMDAGITTESVKNIKYNKIDIPVLVGAKLTFLRLYAGPVASIILSSDSQLGDIIPDMKTHSKNATLGFQAGTGFDLFKTLTFDFRYEGGLSKLGDKFSIANEDFTFDSRSSKFMLSLGFFF